jgi:hypothetical protein
MFRALASIQKEGFVAQNQYLSQTMPKFDSRLPNMVVTGIPTAGTTKPQQVLQNANLGLGTWDPNTRQTSTRDIDIANYATSIDVATSLNTQNNTCKVASLDSLMNTQNPNDRVRCGWIYKKGSTPGAPPAVSQGALGTMTGPVATFPSPQGTWYWSLDDAKKAMEIDKCAALTDCKQVGTPKFKGCAYSKTRGMGIPVDEQGNVKYYRDPKASAPPSSLVRSSGGCPAPPAVGSAAYEYQRSRDVCTPLPNGQLSRDCMLQQITVAGCKPDGSLYISESEKGKIWKVKFNGKKEEFTEKSLAKMKERENRTYVKNPDIVLDNLERNKVAIGGEKLYQINCLVCHQKNGKVKIKKKLKTGDKKIVNISIIITKFAAKQISYSR